MLRKCTSLARPVSQAMKQNQMMAVRSMGGDHGFKPDTVVAQEHCSSLNHLPVPEGSWQEFNSKRQSRYNMYLAGTALLLVATYFGCNAAGVFMFHEIKDFKKVKINVD